MNFAISPFFIGHHAHPLLFAAISLIAGISSAFVEVPFIIISFLLVLLCISAVFYWQSHKSIQIWLLLPISFVAGFTLYQHQISNHIAFQEKFNNISSSITGTVASIEKIQSARHRWHMIIDLEKINDCATKESVAIYSVRHPNVAVGDTVQVEDIIFKKIEKKDFNLYLAKEKISATSFIDVPKITQLQHPAWSINRIITQIRNRIFSSLQQSIDKQTFALFSSIFLGNRAAVKQHMDHAKEPFKYWGTSHYLARSGLHLVIFGIIWHFILGFLPLLFFWKQTFLMLLIACYSLLSWSSVSFNRALIMFFIAKFCLLTQNRLHYVHLIILATCLVLLLNPLQLFYLDFQLSFGLTFALAWFTHIQQHKKHD